MSDFFLIFTVKRVNILDWIFFHLIQKVFREQGVTVHNAVYQVSLSSEGLSVTFEPGHEKMCLMPYANDKDADQPAHPRRMIPPVYISETSRF